MGRNRSNKVLLTLQHKEHVIKLLDTGQHDTAFEFLQREYPNATNRRIKNTIECMDYISNVRRRKRMERQSA